MPGDYFIPLKTAGAEINGSTSHDRTNYYEVVPRGALERALYMESDRMGYFVSALDQAVLDEQRGVVKNEKRNGASNPGSIAVSTIAKALFPEGHPYRRTVIGSMRDLNAATVDDVKDWFRRYYGPNNAYLVLAGGIDLPTAKQLVTKYFGAIPAGPVVVAPDAPVPTLTEEKRDTLTAPVTAPAIFRAWTAPGFDDDDSFALDTLSLTMADANGKLHRTLVREKKLFSQVTVNNTSYAKGGRFQISAMMMPGVDPKVASDALDREIDDYLAAGPTDEEVNRFLASFVFNTAQSYESFAVRGSRIGEAKSFYNDPSKFKHSLMVYAENTPASIKAVGNKWLKRPSYRLTLVPGPRIVPEEDVGMDEGDAGMTSTATASTTAAVKTAPAGTRGPLPAIAATSPIPFPRLQQAQLSNGITIAYAQRPDTVMTNFYLRLPNGLVDVPAGDELKYEYMCAMLRKGFSGLNENEFNNLPKLTGIDLDPACHTYDTALLVTAPPGDVGQAMDWAKQLLTEPTFNPAELARMKDRHIDGVDRSRLSASVLQSQIMQPLLNANAPELRRSLTKPGFAARIRALTMDDLIAQYRRWIRPEGATIDIVSNRPLAELMPDLERTLGSWRVPGNPPPRVLTPHQAAPQIVLVDLPSEVQASLSGGQMVSLGFSDPDEAAEMADLALGSSFTARLNMNLRESKHWSYGINGGFRPKPSGSAYIVNTKVQQDKVGPAIAEIVREVRGIISDRPITAAEFGDIRQGVLSRSATKFAPPHSILNELVNAREHDRALDYGAGFDARVRAVTLDQANAALREQLDPAKWVWTIVGNAKIIRPQLDALGIPVKVVDGTTLIPRE